MSDWCILQVASSATLTLAVSLGEAGFECWTPVDIRQRWAGKPRRQVDQEVPVAKGYVFASAHQLTDLLRLSRSPALTYQVWDSERERMVTKGLPVFRLMRGHSGYAMAKNERLAPLREYEDTQRNLAKQRQEQELSRGPAPKFKAGHFVRCAGGFEGLDLEVVSDNDGKMVELTHPDWLWTIEISAWKLRAVNVSVAAPEQGGAALAA